MNTSIKFGEVLGRFGLGNEMTDEELKALMRATLTEGYPEDLRPLVEAVQAMEREACAKVCEDNADCCNLGSPLYTILSSNAAAIRARGEK